MTDVAAVRARRERTTRAALLERLIAAVPLLTVFVWACLLYAWQAWLVGTPIIFTDELEFTQLARSIAETGHPARRGDPYSFGSLAVLLMAPAWLLDNVHSAYDAAKYLNVVAMCASALPAYGLARMVVGRRPALFAAAGTVAIPAFVYSSLLLEEPLAYTVSTTALFLIARALARPTWHWLAAALAVSLIAPVARTQLAVIPAIFVLSGLVYAWRSAAVRRWRGRWTRGDWVGAVTLTVGAAVLFSAVMGHLSFSWLVATGYYKQRMIEYGIWAAGALAIGLGVLPVIAGLAALARPRDEPRTPGRVAFVTVLATSIAGFGFYTAVKASYISTQFSTLVVERNMIYLAPLLFVGTAMWLERPRLRRGALAVATLVTGFLVLGTQLRLDYPYFEAPGFAILAEANRSLELSQPTIERLLLVVLGVALLLLLLPRLLERRPRLEAGAVATAALLVLAWNVTGQSAASTGVRNNASLFLANFPDPVDWIDRATGGEPAFFLGQRIERNGVHLLEFWNRSLKEVWSLDGSAPGPGPVQTPDLFETNGLLFPDPGYPWVVASAELQLVGKETVRVGGWRLWRLTPPLRLASAITGRDGDGWMSTESAYSQYSTPGGQAGRIFVNATRKGGWGGTDKPATVKVEVGPLVIGSDKQPALGKVTATDSCKIHSNTDCPFELDTPAPPFRVRVTIDKTFVPAELDDRLSDRRQLGAKISYAFEAAQT